MIVMTTFLSLIWPWKGKPLIENEDDFKLLLRSQALSPAFGGMIAFVKETEPLLERGQGQGKVIWPDESMSAVQYLLRWYILYFMYSFLFCVLYKPKISWLWWWLLLWLSKRQRHRQLLPGPLVHQGTHHTTSCMSSACHWFLVSI